MTSKVLESGQGVSYGSATGVLKRVTDEKSAREAKEGDIVFGSGLTVRMAILAANANGFILCGNEADHTIGYLREIWKSAILVNSLYLLKEGDEVTVDGFSGKVFTGKTEVKEQSFRQFDGKINTKLYLEQSIPRMASHAASLNTSGVGLFRLNMLIQELGKHPQYFIKNNKEKELETFFSQAIVEIAKAFSPRPVWIRTMDFDSSELAGFEGGQDEVHEHNPMLGLRGLARDLHDKDTLRIQYKAIKSAVDTGLSNIGILYPLVRDISEYKEAKGILKDCGLEPHKDVKVGSIFETPSSCLQIEQFIEEGLDFAFFGINDMVQYTLAVDRTNLAMQHLYRPNNSAVLHLLFHLLEECKKHNVETTMTFLTPLKPYLKQMLDKGLTSLSLKSDRLHEIGTLLEEVE